MTTVNQLITDLKKWHDADAPILYQYITNENGAMSNAEFIQVAEWLDMNEEFADAMSELMGAWINQARATVANLSPCCNAPLFSEVCDGCNDYTQAVPVCEVCGQVDQRQELRRCTTHPDDICFSCNYLEKIAGETMLDDGTTAKLCGRCLNRVNGGN